MTRPANGIASFLAVVLFVLSATSTPSRSAFGQAGIVRGFVGASPDFVAFLHWTELGGTLSGQYQALYVPPTDPLTVESMNMSFTGIHSGPNVSITFSGFLSSTTWTGVLRGSALTFAVPRRDGLLETLVMRVGTVEDYNRAALALRQRVAYIAEMAARRKAVLDADQAFGRAYQQLVSDTVRLYRDTERIADFTKVREAYARTWVTMQGDNERLRADAAKIPLSCHQLSTVRHDLSTLRHDMSTFRHHNGTFNSIRSPILGGVGGVRRDAQVLRKALQGLGLANAADPTRKTSQQYLEQLSAMSSGAVRMAEDQVQASLAALRKPDAESEEFNRKAARLLEDATAFVSSLTCTQ